MLSDNADRARNRFLELLDELNAPVHALCGTNAVHHASRILGDLKTMWKSDAPDMNTTRVLHRTPIWLTELERLIAGQQTLFSPTRPRKPKSVTKIFRQLFGILNNFERLAEEDARHLRGHIHPSIEYRARLTGMRPGSKPTRPAKKRAGPREKLPTFSQARDILLVALGRTGWRLSPALKIPHATSPSGNLRLWFKAQAVHYSHGNSVNDMGRAHTLDVDTRQEAKDPGKFVAWVTQLAAQRASQYAAHKARGGLGSPSKGFREVALYQPGKVFINGKFQTNFTFSYSHQPVDAAAVVLDLCKDGDVIKVKQGRYVWTFKVTRDKGHVRARQTNITPQEKKWSKDHPGFSPRASHRASRPDAIGSLVHKAATKVSRLFQGKR